MCHKINYKQKHIKVIVKLLKSKLMIAINFALGAWLCLIAATLAAVYVFWHRRYQKIQQFTTNVIADFDVFDMIHPSTFLGIGPLSSDPWLNKLAQMDKTDPLKRQRNWYDEWFERNVEHFSHDGKCLAYINHYGHLEDKFWQCIKNPDKNLELQKLLISVCYNKTFGVYYVNFSNLLFNYARNYELSPELLNVINNDERFKSAKETYEIAKS